MKASKMFIEFFFALILLLGTRANPTTTPPTLAEPSTEISMCPCDIANGTTASHSPMIPSTVIHGMTCMCHTGSAPGNVARDDYRYSPGIGVHKLHTRAATWNEARKMCNEEGGYLAIVNSFNEAHVLRDIFTKAGPVKGASYLDLAYVGIHDMYKENEWVTILGDSLFKTGYTEWSDKWGGQPDNGGGNQNCGVFLKEGGLDDVNCNVPFAFFCELPMGMTYTMH